MDTIKLFDSELKVMEIIWEREPISAKEISSILCENIGWNKNTTYTIIKKLIEKEVLCREEPNFICTAKLRKEQVQSAETKSLIEKLYQGSKKAFFAAFLQNEKLSREELEEIKRLINEQEVQ
ncbi:MAG: putative transcriptional regulator [Herbinix sp.]|jgi:predicted transcriptional regulator|nr:putative transcriptional regulator [Herbinix sp.]